MTDEPDVRLFGTSPESYPGDYEGHLLEQYKLYVESADNLSARRVSSNNFLLTLNSAILALYGVGAAFDGSEYWMFGLPFAGMLAAFVWFRTIRSYVKLNEVKFKIIQKIEKRLPLRLYAHEWHLAGRTNPKAYFPVTKVESQIPLLYGALHVGLLGVRVVLAFP